VADSTQRVAEGASLLARAMTQEASVAAYTNVFRFVEIMALMIAIYIGLLLFRGELRRQSASTSESPA